MKRKNHSRRTAPRHKTSDPINLPFIEHAYELRRRLYFIGISVIVWGSAAYAVQQHIVSILLKPSQGERFIYTTPGGGIDFLFRICVYSGLVFSLPVIIYNVLRFIEPLITRSSQRFIAWGAIASALLAIAGIAFGYYIGLPAALHFLSHQFTTVQIRPLVTIQSYLQFVIVYMVGSALLFQLPLILVLINRIKPLQPKRLLHYERWVILVAFILSGLMNPTPNLISQLLIAGPFIVMYQIGILLIMFINKRAKVYELYEQDVATQSLRSNQIEYDQPSPTPSTPVTLTQPSPAVRPTPGRVLNSPYTTIQRPRPAKYTDYVSRRPVFQDIRPMPPRSSLNGIDRLPKSPV